MEALLKAFEEKNPEIVFEWHDAETEAKGYAVINSLRGGAAGGGTRMRKGLDKREVESLAKTMEIKFSVCGPQIGGAKSGIDFDPADPRKHGVLTRWYAALFPILKNYYGTGGDLNIDEIHEVIPITSEMGLLHPQEGVVNGHIKAGPEATQQIISQLQDGVSKQVFDENYVPIADGRFKVADMITGFGVAVAVLHHYNAIETPLEGKRVIVQGWGNVAAASAYYLAKFGASIVAIIDRVGGIINQDGLSFEEVKTLFIEKNGNQLNAPALLSFDEVNAQVWDLNAEIFIPAAASRLVTQDQMERLIKNGLETISCGANVPFADKEIFFGPISRYLDEKVALLPDFIANCGMARVFAYLMKENADLSDAAIFEDVSKTIENALHDVYKGQKLKTDITRNAFEIALHKLV